MPSLFKDGILSDDWEPMSDTEYKGNEIYFGFVSKNKYLVSETDKVDLILTLNEDIKGKGADITGILKAGIYQSSSQFTLFHLEDFLGEEDAYAFLNNDGWNVRWRLDVTSHQGWMKKRKSNRNVNIKKSNRNLDIDLKDVSRFLKEMESETYEVIEAPNASQVFRWNFSNKEVHNYIYEQEVRSKTGSTFGGGIGGTGQEMSAIGVLLIKSQGDSTAEFVLKDINPTTTLSI